MRFSNRIVRGHFMGAEIEPGTFHGGAKVPAGTFHLCFGTGAFCGGESAHRVADGVNRRDSGDTPTSPQADPQVAEPRQSAPRPRPPEPEAPRRDIAA